MFRKWLLIFLLPFCSLLKAQSDSLAQKSPNTSTNNLPPALGEVFKPKISLGAGMLSFHGDLYAKKFQAPWTAKIGYDLNVSQRLFKAWQLNFNILFGKLAANEWLNNRQENFQSEIRAGGISILYDFGNFIPEHSRVRPWLSVGVNSFEFLSKTDLLDNVGNKYHYWTDGSIKNMAEDSPGSANAINLVRDYRYETDIRELNKDGFGKYPERAWAFPIGFGALMKVTDRVDFKIGFQYYITTTDYVDGITNNSLGTRQGNKQRDNFAYTSFALQYDLVINKKSKIDSLPDDYFDGIDWLAIDKDDYDGDGVRDWDDKCQGTPKDVKVDNFGCPFDDDKDGVANHADNELDTPEGIAVNMEGVGLTDEYWQNWYNVYMDSGQVDPQIEIVQNFYKLKDTTQLSNVVVDKNNQENVYTVELARYNGPVPTQEMIKLLSIGDVKSTLLPDNTTVLYTAGTYKEIQKAVKRRDEFIAEGNTNAQVGYFKNGDLKRLTQQEIDDLINGKSNSNSNQSSNPNITNTNLNSSSEVEEEFAKGDVVFRVQLGAYRNRISKEIFKNAGSVVELKTDDNYYRYATKGFKTIEGAASLRANLVVEGYTDAFITAYRNGKRIPLSETKATMDSQEKENIEDNSAFSSIDKSQITFKIQIGALRKAASPEFEEKIKDLNDLDKQTTSSGMTRYTAGKFNDYSKADKFRKDLNDKGFVEAFVIAVFKGEVISIQEALELLK
jgi:hypothetical protein